jgi:L-rhamnose mutarotase
MRRITYLLLTSILFLLFFITYNKSEANSGEVKMENEKVTKRVGSLIRVKPEYEERYIILHRHTFPGVLDRIKKSNIRNYSIFLLDGMLFSYYEYVGNDYDADMKAIADSTTKDWWKLTDPMQEPLSSRKKGEWWAEMDEILNLKKMVGSSEKAQRIALVAEVIPGKEEDIKELCKKFPAGLEEETNNQNFQNCHLFYKDGKIYYYYEYVGDDLRKSMGEINKSKKFTTFQSDMNNNYLVKKNNGYWQLMKEVFHTD